MRRELDEVRGTLLTLGGVGLLSWEQKYFSNDGPDHQLILAILDASTVDAEVYAKTLGHRIQI
jgi:hypothetical protein